MGPSHCVTHSELIQAATQHCEATIASVATSVGQQATTPATPATATTANGPNSSHAATGQLPDALDPMHSVALKEAAQLYIDLLTQCSACVDTRVLQAGSVHSGGVSSEGGDRGVVGVSVVDRFSVCVHSPSVDVRAAGAKAAVNLVNTWLAR